MKYFLLVFSYIVFSNNINAQDTSKIKSLTFSGYLEAYHTYDFSTPANHELPSFLYSFNRTNEINLNLGFLKANYQTENVRSNLAVMYGTYAQYNLANEQGLLKNLLEANVGVKVSKKHNLWIDAGIMPSHLGFESAIGKDCWNLTRSILADNSPYYEAGVKLGYTTKNEKLFMSVMYLNGWQKIQRATGNTTPAFGTQLTYKPTANFTFNWSTYVGNEQPDIMARWRIFNNLYCQYQATKKIGIIAGFDIGQQQKKVAAKNYDYWYTPIVILQYKTSDKIRIATRVEYYSDKNQVIISTNTNNGFQTVGYSLNLDYQLYNNVLFRIEGRRFTSKDKIFNMNKTASNGSNFITSSLSIAF